MQVELKIDAEAVQQKLVDSLIQSAIGTQITKAINDGLLKSDWQRGTVVEQAVKQVLYDELRALITKILREERQEELRQLVMQKLTTTVLDQATTELVSKLWSEK